MKGYKETFSLALGALGIVFGDIGTSPLYALQVTLSDLPVDKTDVFGILSLIFWSLFFIISIKYLAVIFRADNDGEGGALALLALLKRHKAKNRRIFYLIAIFASGLLLGDGMLTPAISVTSAIEGLTLISPNFNQFILPLSAGILLLLFFLQHKGTAKIGIAFGPILLIWFITIAALGLVHIIEYPEVLYALNPYYGFLFFKINGFKAYLLLGGIFLVVTGGEALYADIGHFGKNPIRYSWFLVAFPALLLNYFGQGANLLMHPHAIENPFYHLAPDWFFIPLMIISTMATVIASQSVISATFSLTRQAILLGFYPRIPIIQTSEKMAGQIYIPQVNFFLMIGTFTLLLLFKSSSGLSHAYGIAVNLVMLSVTILVTYAARHVWKWSLLRTMIVFGFFLSIDCLFLGANIHKFLTGGWAPVGFALLVATFMYTWNEGILILKKKSFLQKEDFAKVLRQLHYKSLNRLKGITAIFITDVYDLSGHNFFHFLKLSLSIPENILILNYKVRNRPYIEKEKRFKLEKLSEHIILLTLHYGFMDDISIPDALIELNEAELLSFDINVHVVTYLVEIPHIIATKDERSLPFFWQEKLFSFLIRNYSANLDIEFYNLPYNRSIAIGAYYEI